MSDKKNNSYYFFLAIIIVMSVVFGLSWLNTRLPGGYYFLESEKYWHSEIHRKVNCYKAKIQNKDENICTEQVIPSTVIDHAVRGDYILALRVDRDMHFSKEYCDSCRTLSAPCAEYWVVNWKSKENSRSMEKESFITFLKGIGIKFPEFEYDMPISALKACQE